MPGPRPPWVTSPGQWPFRCGRTRQPLRHCALRFEYVLPPITDELRLSPTARETYSPSPCGRGRGEGLQSQGGRLRFLARHTPI